MMIPFNKPFSTGKELKYIRDVISYGHLSGNGFFTKKCQEWFEQKYSWKKTLLTTSCTDALEMAAILLNINEGDEVIMPCFTFVSTANAFILRGAKIKFVDSSDSHPNIDEFKIESLISNKTKAIVVVHYAGISCNMSEIKRISLKHNIPIIEDAAQAIDNVFIDDKGNKFSLGSIGDISTFSFHETKNIQCGEGGLLVINNDKFLDRSEIIWEKGTNRSSFFRGEINKYGWVDLGSSFLPSEITAAFLWSQLEMLDEIQSRRIAAWKDYMVSLKDWANINNISLPSVPSYSGNNGHIFYLIFNKAIHRTLFIDHMKKNGINAVFHYQSLNKSDFFKSINPNENRLFPNSDKFSDCLVRLPLYVGIETTLVINKILKFNFD